MSGTPLAEGAAPSSPLRGRSSSVGGTGELSRSPSLARSGSAGGSPHPSPATPLQQARGSLNPLDPDAILSPRGMSSGGLDLEAILLAQKRTAGLRARLDAGDGTLRHGASQGRPAIPPFAGPPSAVRGGPAGIGALRSGPLSPPPGGSPPRAGGALSEEAPPVSPRSPRGVPLPGGMPSPVIGGQPPQVPSTTALAPGVVTTSQLGSTATVGAPPGGASRLHRQHTGPEREGRKGHHGPRPLLSLTTGFRDALPGAMLNVLASAPSSAQPGHGGPQQQQGPG